MRQGKFETGVFQELERSMNHRKAVEQKLAQLQAQSGQSGQPPSSQHSSPSHPITHPLSLHPTASSSHSSTNSPTHASQQLERDNDLSDYMIKDEYV